MTRRLNVLAAGCLLVGFGINFGVSAILGARSDQAIVPTGFGFIDPGFAPTVGWGGDFGRDRLSVAAIGDNAAAGIPVSTLEDRFRSMFGKPNGSMGPGELDTWSGRLFPRWGEWAYRVPRGERLIIATGFPLRSFAGYVTLSHSGSPMLSGTGGPAPTWTERGILWRDRTRPVRGIVWIPLPLGTVVNSLVFGGPLLAMAMVPSWRRARRIRRGHCPFCNYDLRGEFTRPCSECGRQVTAV